MKLFDCILQWLEEVVLAVGLFVMVALNFINVVCRYLLPQTPFSFTEELTLLLFVWNTMFGISCGYKRCAHTGLTLVTDALPAGLKKAGLVVSTLSSAVLMVVIFWSGTLLVLNQIKYGNIMPGMKISLAWGGLAIPVGAAVIFFRIIQIGVRELGAPVKVETAS